MHDKKLGVIDINSCVDFTLLDARATEKDVEKLCDIAYKNRYGVVCVSPCNVAYAKAYIASNLNSEIKVASVVGFPLGANALQTKVFEAKKCIEDGADEIDFVINIGKVKQGKFDYIKNEISNLRKAVKSKILKVIIETCYLDENEIVKLCKICVACKVDYVKTSTGFGTAGATLDNVVLIKKTVGGNCKIKASGGIRTREQAVDFINAGVERIGTSHII